MIPTFRVISIAEGISFLAILFITMPLKYGWEIGGPNKIIGMMHGLLFLLYIVFAVVVRQELRWSLKTLSIVLACSIIPFGTFWMDKKYLRTQI